MRIFSQGGNFLPENFEILRFYEQTLLFAWHGDKLKVFDYDDFEGASNPRLLLSPGEVKEVKNFEDRIFITCIPYGAYKLSRTFHFAVLSTTAIGIGPKFYQVFRVEEDDYISLGDKQAKTSRLLLKHVLPDGATSNVVGLNADSVDNVLFNILLENAENRDEVSILTRGYEIFKVTSDVVKILYSCHCLITDVIEVKKNDELKGLLYLTDKNIVIFMYANDGELIFEKIVVNCKVKTAYAWVDEPRDNFIWIVHSDGVKTYRSRKILGNRTVETAELDKRNITCLRKHGSKILGLTSMGELVEVDPKMNEDSVDNKAADFVQLKSNMFEGIDSIVETICEKVKELQSFDNKLLDQQSALKRINMAACNQNISLVPKLRVQKIADKTFINCKFGHGMPEKCQISFSVRSGGRKIFATKLITENETNIELPLPNSLVSEALNISIDLITLTEEGYSWCISKDCIKNTGDNEIDVQVPNEDRTNFVNARLAALDNLMMEDKIDIVKLNRIKDSVRKRFDVV